MRPAAAATAAACAVLLGALGAHAEVGDAPDTGVWTTDGPVYAVARSGATTFIGGDFSYVGRRTGPGVPLAAAGQPAAGAPTPGFGAFPEVAGGRVMAAAAAPDGSVYIGGDFTHVGGVTRRGLARLVPGAAGALALDSTFAPAPDGAVRALAVGQTAGKDDDVIYVGGNFDSMNGALDQRNLAALNRFTGVIAAAMAQPDNTVRSLDVLRQGATAYPIVVAAGAFANVGGAARSQVAALWGDDAGIDEGKLITAFNPALPAGAARAVHLGDAKPNSDTTEIGAPVYVGGDFGLSTFSIKVTTAGAASSAAITGIANPTFACTGCPASVRSLRTSPDGAVLYIGGRFDTVSPGNLPRRNVVAIRGVPDVYASPVPPLVIRPWDPSPDGIVHALAVSDAGDVYLGGDFTQARDAVRGVEGRLALAATSPNVDAAALHGWDPVAIGGLPGGDGGTVTALAVSGARVYAGGSFTALGGRPHANVAALGAGGELLDAWRPDTDGPVHALAAGNDRVYLGGSFDHVKGEPRARLGAVSAAGEGAPDPDFRPDPGPACTGPGCSAVMSLSLLGQTLYVGGAFESLAAKPRANAGAVDALSGAARDWAPNPDGNVYALLATCGTVYAGGAFSNAGGAARSRIAALDPASGTATDWDPSVESGIVYALARDQGVVYAGGSFARIGGTERKRLAALDAETGAATAWNPSVSGTTDLVRAVAAPAGSSVVYVGGRFTTAGRAERANIAALDRADASATPWNPGTDGPVRALVANDGSLIAGGEFRQVGRAMQQGVGSFGLGSGVDQPRECSAPVPEPVVEELVAPPPESAPAPRPVDERDLTAPALTRLRVTNRRFRTARRPRRTAPSASRKRVPVGTTFRYRLSEPAAVRLAFARKTRVRCRPPRRRACYRWRAAGAVGHLSPAGKIKARFAGRVGRRWLRPGVYLVRVRATDPAGNRSAARRLVITIVRR